MDLTAPEETLISQSASGLVRRLGGTWTDVCWRSLSGRTLPNSFRQLGLWWRVAVINDNVGGGAMDTDESSSGDQAFLIGHKLSSVHD